MVGECELMTVCNNYNAISRSDDPKGKIKQRKKKRKLATKQCMVG